MKLQQQIHSIAPVYNKKSHILILGSFPSPKSREFGFYYGHPQNIFWQTLAKILQQPEPAATIVERQKFALKNHIALWDVIQSCEIYGAADHSIRNAVVNQFEPIFACANIRAIFTVGKTAYQLYCRLAEPVTKRPAIYLPSTSPANRAAQNKPEFLACWNQICDYL